MRSKGILEKDIRAYIDAKHKDLDQRSRTHIYRLSLGLIPKDDFTKDDLDGWKKPERDHSGDHVAGTE